MTATGGAVPATTNGASPSGSGQLTQQASATASEFRIRLGYLSGYAPSSSSTSTAGGSTASATSTNSAAQYPGILAPLGATNGLMFPYTPTISNNQEVDYSTMTMTHANTDYHSYNHTPNVTMSISGKFTIQNYQEGCYALACIHFCRSVSKMYFGEQDASTGLSGTPPPILQLNGYGTYMYNQLRCYMKSSSWSYEEGVDIVNINIDGTNYVYLPAIFTLQMSLVVQNTSRAQRKDFKLDSFRSGVLMSSPPNNSGWI